jgi:anti-sigma regulatory factor (Ser/Thr protein kinase)
MDNAFTGYRIQERSYVAYVKREIHRELLQAKFGEVRVAEIDIIVSELASNLVKHANGGEFLYRIYEVDDKDSAFEIVCIDNGSGIADLGRMMKDGVSTTKTLGQGLGAISRLSDIFQLYTIPNWGTIVYCMASTNKEKMSRKVGLDLEVKGLVVNKTGEDVSGDGYKVRRTRSTVEVFLGDGLGHGVHAHEAVKRAGEAFMECEEHDPVGILRSMHEKVRRTRGLVGAVAVLDLSVKQWKLCAIGNIMTRIYNGITFKNYMSYNGTIGLNIPNSLHESTFEADKNQYIIMTSDGIRTRYDLTRYPSFSKYDMMVLAGAIFKDYNRGTDDSSIVIARVG